MGAARLTGLGSGTYRLSVEGLSLASESESFEAASVRASEIVVRETLLFFFIGVSRALFLFLMRCESEQEREWREKRAREHQQRIAKPPLHRELNLCMLRPKPLCITV